MKDWDIGLRGAGREVGGIKPNCGEASGEVGADAVCVDVSTQHGSEVNRCRSHLFRLAIHCLALLLANALILADEEVKVLVRALD